MTQLGEAVAVALLPESSEECPFLVPHPPVVSKEEEEHPKNDDLLAVARLQVSKGGTLGRNIAEASHGARDTVNDIFPAGPAQAYKPEDTKRNDGGGVTVDGDPVKRGGPGSPGDDVLRIG
jgi:hypothetical protein